MRIYLVFPAASVNPIWHDIEPSRRCAVEAAPFVVGYLRYRRNVSQLLIYLLVIRISAPYDPYRSTLNKFIILRVQYWRTFIGAEHIVYVNSALLLLTGSKAVNSEWYVGKYSGEMARRISNVINFTKISMFTCQFRLRVRGWRDDWPILRERGRKRERRRGGGY